MLTEIANSNFESFETYESFENFKKGALKAKVQNVTQKVTAKSSEIKKDIKKATQNTVAKLPVKVQNAVAAAKSPAKKIAVIAKNVGGKVGNTAKLALLLPYVPLMKLMIKRKGLVPKNGIEELTKQFHNVIILNKNSFNDADSEAFESYLTLGTGANGEHFAYETIIPPIVQFLTNAAKKIKEATGLAEEKSAVKEVEDLAKQALNENNKVPIGEPAPPAPPSEGTNYVPLIITGVALLGLGLALKG